MNSLLMEVERELGVTNGPYFLGEDISLVDIMFTPFLERMSASLPYFKGFVLRGNVNYPNLQRWFAAMDERESYRGIKSDYVIMIIIIIIVYVPRSLPLVYVSYKYYSLLYISPSHLISVCYCYFEILF